MKTARGAISASIEMTVRDAAQIDLDNFVPQGTRIYLPDLGMASDADLVAAAARLADLGFRPVPHVVARRCESLTTLEERLKALSSEAGVDDILIVGGGVSTPAGPFSSAMDVLQTGLADKYAIRSIGVAGHPEGSPDMSDALVAGALRQKLDFARTSDAQFRLVTQFGFDGALFVDWADRLRDEGIDLPIHFGVAGPARISTLVKYSVACGVGNSLRFLKSRTSSILALASKQSPEPVLAPIEARWREDPASNIAQIHIFAFGGVRGSAEWLTQRGSWTLDGPLAKASGAGGHDG